MTLTHLNHNAKNASIVSFIFLTMKHTTYIETITINTTTCKTWENTVKESNNYKQIHEMTTNTIKH